MGPILSRGRTRRRLGMGGVAAAAMVAVGSIAPWAWGAGTPTLTMTPAPTDHPYADGQSLTLSVGPNSRFSAHTRIEVLECAAPKGVVPVDDSTCDGNTAQYGSVLVEPDGSLQVPAYTLYQLPSAALGEQSNHAPVCNATQECVLYIGQDQNDFSQPKMFSPTFTVGSATASATPTAQPAAGGSTSPGGSASAGGSNGQSGASGSSPVSPGVSLSDPSGTSGATSVDTGVSSLPAGVLAFTGIAELPGLVGTGVLLMLVGTAGIHLRRRARP
jgi:hypothetical protein